MHRQQRRAGRLPQKGGCGPPRLAPAVGPVPRSTTQRFTRSGGKSTGSIPDAAGRPCQGKADDERWWIGESPGVGALSLNRQAQADGDNRDGTSSRHQCCPRTADLAAAEASAAVRGPHPRRPGPGWCCLRGHRCPYRGGISSTTTVLNPTAPRYVLGVAATRVRPGLALLRRQGLAGQRCFQPASPRRRRTTLWRDTLVQWSAAAANGGIHLSGQRAAASLPDVVAHGAAGADQQNRS